MILEAIIVIGAGVGFIMVAIIGIISIIRTPSKKDEYPYNGIQG